MEEREQINAPDEQKSTPAVSELEAAVDSSAEKPSSKTNSTGKKKTAAKRRRKKKKKKGGSPLDSISGLVPAGIGKKPSKKKSKTKESSDEGKTGENQGEKSSSKKGGKKTRTAKQRRRFINETLYLLLKIGIAIVAFAALLMLVVGAYRVSDNYMEPMVKNGDLIFFNRLDKSASAGDVVIVKYEGHETASRVVAKAGDTVDIKSGAVLVNGNRQFEDSIYYETEQISGGATFPLKVPEGKIFVLGDQRKKAVDSRMFGCVSTSEIEGKLALVVRRREF